MAVLTMLVVLGVVLVYIRVKTYLPRHLKYVQLIVCQLYPNQPVTNDTMAMKGLEAFI